MNQVVFDTKFPQKMFDSSNANQLSVLYSATINYLDWLLKINTRQLTRTWEFVTKIPRLLLNKIAVPHCFSQVTCNKKFSSKSTYVLNYRWRVWFLCFAMTCTFNTDWKKRTVSHARYMQNLCGRVFWWNWTDNSLLVKKRVFNLVKKKKS